MNKPSVKRERIDPSHHHKDCGGLIQYYNLHLSVHDFPGLDICAGLGPGGKISHAAYLHQMQQLSADRIWLHPPDNVAA